MANGGSTATSDRNDVLASCIGKQHSGQSAKATTNTIRGAIAPHHHHMNLIDEQIQVLAAGPNGAHRDRIGNSATVIAHAGSQVTARFPDGTEIPYRLDGIALNRVASHG